MENFEHFFTRVWNECNCVVVWRFFGIAFLCDWNENWPFPVLWPLLSFPNLLTYWCITFTASYFRIWNNSTGIPSPPLALFVVMLPKAHLTSHSRISGPKWVIIPLCAKSLLISDQPWLDNWYAKNKFYRSRLFFFFSFPEQVYLLVMYICMYLSL